MAVVEYEDANTRDQVLGRPTNRVEGAKHDEAKFMSGEL